MESFENLRINAAQVILEKIATDILINGEEARVAEEAIELRTILLDSIETKLCDQVENKLLLLNYNIKANIMGIIVKKNEKQISPIA